MSEIVENECKSHIMIIISNTSDCMSFWQILRQKTNLNTFLLLAPTNQCYNQQKHIFNNSKQFYFNSK